MQPRIAMVAATLGALLWIVAGLSFGASPTELFMIGLVLIGIGLGVATWATTRGRNAGASGFVVAAIGTLVFLGAGLGDLGSLSLTAAHTFGVGVGLMAAIGIASPRRALLFRIGAAAAALACALWIVADLDGGAHWQLGNVVVGVGMATAAALGAPPAWREE